ncbi:P-loop containing nucleoside triphosphate hydrolase protein [Favolaschia claudopus]|uniref:DNA 3'-5' helicase n=1 Tax=Favolaschia claudopus TaxID=2862362 RepID=A0AAV9ZWR0_9AGAR
MNGGKDYSAVSNHLPDPKDVQSLDDLPQGIIFTNHVKTQVLCRHLRRRYPHLRGAIDLLHAHRTAKAKRRVMKQFRKGKIKLLVATEAAGMGADISNIELIIQFGVPSSLSVWIQRAGRAGRSRSLQARAILLAEKSMFQRRKKRRKPGGDAENSVPALRPDGDGPELAEPLDDSKKWGKNVDPALREYISTKKCRCKITDQYFNNPTRLGTSPPIIDFCTILTRVLAPTGDCCENCITRLQPPPSTPPQTPEPTDSPPSSAHSTPSKQRNRNGKRSMVSGVGPSTRRTEHLKRARSALEKWRVNTCLQIYGATYLTHDVLLPDK